MLKPNFSHSRFFLSLFFLSLFTFQLCYLYLYCYSLFRSSFILSFSLHFIIMCLPSIYKDILLFISLSPLFTNVCNVFLFISLSLSVILLASSLYIRRECNAYEDFGVRPKNKRFHPKKNF
jgi:hypothetical protein